MVKKIKSVSGHYAKYLLPTFEQSENTSATRQMIFFLTFFWVLIGQKQVFLPAEKIKEGKKPTFKFYFFSEKSVTGYEATLNKLL